MVNKIKELLENIIDEIDTLMIKISGKYHSIKSSIKQTIKMLPIIWEDRDYDQYFIYRMLYYKLKFYAEEQEEFNKMLGDPSDQLKSNLFWAKVARDLAYFKMKEEYGIFYHGVKGKEIIGREEYKEVKDRKLLFKILEYKLDHFWV